MQHKRCDWCSTDPLYCDYHDHEWGMVITDPTLLFRQLCLEGQQAGLAWITVLKKRVHYDRHFFDLGIEAIAALSDAQLLEKQQDTNLIRHLGKLQAIRSNAQAWLTLSEQHAPSTWLWQFIETYANPHIASQQMAKQLKLRGFKFVGPTICYAFMQAVGMINDHQPQCFLYQQ